MIETQNTNTMNFTDSIFEEALIQNNKKMNKNVPGMFMKLLFSDKEMYNATKDIIMNNKNGSFDESSPLYRFSSAIQMEWNPLSTGDTISEIAREIGVNSTITTIKEIIEHLEHLRNVQDCGWEECKFQEHSYSIDSVLENAARNMIAHHYH